MIKGTNKLGVYLNFRRFIHFMLIYCDKKLLIKYDIRSDRFKFVCLDKD